MEWLARFLSGPIIDGAIGAYKAKLEAGNNRDRMAADLAQKELELQGRERELSTQVLIAEQGRWWTSLPRALFAYCVVIYFGKVLVWDKVLGWGSTDPITGLVGDWTGIIITAYFGGRTVEKTAGIVAGAIARLRR